MLLLSASNANSQVIPFVATYDQQNTLDFTLTNPFSELEEGIILDPEVIVVDPPLPPLPPNLQPPLYTPEPFDYLTLPRLQNKRSTAILIGVQSTKILLGRTSQDISPHFLSGDIQDPLTGSSVGTLKFADRVTSSNLDLTQLAYNVGMPIVWQHCKNGNCSLVKRLYLLSIPQIDVSQDNLTTLTFNCGDELELFSKLLREPNVLYCGLPPRNAREAARIYTKYNGLFTQAFPPGHSLIEPPNQFLNESPYDFLQSLYSPVDYDVRSDKLSNIVVIPRKQFDPTTAIPLSFLECLELSLPIVSQYKPYSRVRAYNQYKEITDIKGKKQTLRSISGVPTNTNPWFQNGYTETEENIWTIGDTVVSRNKRSFGWIPTDATFTIELDPCAESPLDVEWGVFKREVFSLGYSQHISGSFLVHSQREYTDETLVRETITEGIGELLELRTSFKITEYKNVPQINPKVCEKDYIHYALQTITQEYGLDDTDTLIKLSGSGKTYRARGVDTDSTNSYVGTGIDWLEINTSGRWDADLKTWIKQPPNYVDNSTPPNSPWIRPNSLDKQAFTTVTSNLIENQFGRLEAPPINSPNCFNLSELTTFANRWLREKAGLSRALSLVVPYTKPLALGRSVLYTDRNGNVTPYTVYSVEINQTLNQATKTVVLMREYL